MSYELWFLLPYLVAAAAIVDAARMRAPWYWYLIILIFPLMGLLTAMVNLMISTCIYSF